MALAIDLHEHLFEVPTQPAGSHALDAAFPDLGLEHWSEPVPPTSHSLMANIDATLLQQVLDIPQQEREADAQHHREADDLKLRFNAAKRIGFGHPRTPSTTIVPLKLV